MNARSWPLVIHDARGRRRRGRVTYADSLPDELAVPEAPDEFAIYVLTAPQTPLDVPERIAVCSPGVPKIRLLGDDARQEFPRRIEDLTLTPQRMAAYAAGAIVAAVTLPIDASDAFPAHSDHPRLDRVALGLVEAADADAIAPFLALIRTELGLSPGADPLDELGMRLLPDDPKDRPPPRAPGVVRLAKALRRLRGDQAPETDADTFAADLRFLRTFEQRDWPAEALNRLFEDVKTEPEKRTSVRKRRPANIVPMRREPSPPPEDA